MKRLTVFIVGTVMALSAIFGIILSPLFASNAYAGSIFPSGVHGVLANHQLRLLPRHTTTVGSTIGMPETEAGYPYFQIVQRSGISYTVLYENTDAVTPAALPNNGEWEFAGLFEYRFFTTDQLSANVIGTIGSGSSAVNIYEQPFHIHTVNVMQSEFRFALPTNSEDILPNVSIPGLAIVVPLPTSFYDIRGNDLFEVRRDANLNRYVPHIDRLARLYADLPDAGATARPSGQFELLEFYRNLVLEDTTIEFFGATGAMVPSNNTAGSITVAGRRTFTPTVAGNNYHAVFSYVNRFDSSIIANLESHRIDVDAVSIGGALIGAADFNRVVGEGRTPEQNQADQIRFENRPVVGPLAGTMRLNEEITLPSATVSMSREPQLNENGTTNNAFNPVRFNTAETATAFTFIRAEILITGMSGAEDAHWRPARTLEWQEGHTVAANPGSFYTRITDFRFIPTELGEYRFIYFTTTIFGAGFDYSEWGTQHIFRVNQHGETVTTGGTRMIRHDPFARIHVATDTVPPRIMWTNAYDFDSSGRAVYLSGGAVINFDNTDDMSRYLPTRAGTASRPTQVASQMVNVNGDQTDSHLLVLPALLGWDNETAARDITYTITITRSVPGATSDTSVTFSNWDWTGTNAPTARTAASGNGNFQPYNPRQPLVINFAAGVPYFTNGAFGGPTVGNLNGSNSLLPGTATREARYTITVFANDRLSVDHAGQTSGSLTYTFEVVTAAGFTMHNEDPTLHGAMRPELTARGNIDILRWNAANPSDLFTDAANIEVNYYLAIHVTSGGEVFTHPITGNTYELMFLNITEEIEELGGNRAEFEFDPAESTIAQAILDEMSIDGVLNISLIAVARNFFAMNNGNAAIQFEFDREAWLFGEDQPNGVTVDSASFDKFSIEFGSSATIQGNDGGPVDFIVDPTDTEWDDQVTLANTHLSGSTLQQYQRVNLPEFLMHYADEASALSSVVTFSIQQPDNGGRIGVLPFSTNLAQITHNTSGTSTHNFLGGTGASAFHFYPSMTGEHILTMTVSNHGGNLTVFMATFYVVGEVHYGISVAAGATSNMHVGQTMTVPGLAITIRGVDFVSVGQEIMAAGVSAQSPWRRVGSFTLGVVADNGMPADFDPSRPMEFTPSFAATYSFIFNIHIENSRLQTLSNVGINMGISPLAGDIDATITHQVVVTTLGEGDIAISLINSTFSALDSLIDDTYQVWIPQLGTQAANAEGIRTIIVSDDMLNDAMHQYATGQYQYGHIILPSWQVVMANNDLTPPQGFDPESYITVRAPRAPDNEFILDTREEFDQDNRMTQFTIGGRAHDFFFFQPIGLLDTQNLTGRTIDNRVNPDIFADGTYIVTYTAHFEGITTQIIFHLQVGDIARPTIHFTDEAYEQFTQIWTRGYGASSRFTIDTADITVDAAGGLTQ
ncbi:MAG: hypothetical protein FWE31_03620, partial [Firmicutes bacterium]|nr:hypothetical protein [Bacillota bacterium]